MIDRVLAKVFGTQHERDIKKLLPRVERINALEPSLQKLSDDELSGKTAELKARLAEKLEGVPEEELKQARARALDDLLEEAFAVVREASVRALGMRPFDVQLIGGMVLHQGKISEMKTGEGKTLVATLPVYLNALTGRGVHVVTVNDYLARRDSEWMGRLYKFLGLTVGVIQNNYGDRERQEAYRCDVTYGTNNEIGFDYLRDNMKFELEQMVQREHVYAIIDEFTGRQMPGRRWSDGLHQAVESKEGVKIEAENQTLATITFQNLFRMYEKLAGMTGTADTEAAEFDKIYNLEVVVIPPNRQMVRKDQADLVYRTEREKFNAIVDEIKVLNEKGQPALVGTISIEKSEALSSALKRKGVPHVVLNAKYHEKEAEIVAQAGRKGAVTIATNMAGRGTDILLGGNPEFAAAQKKKDVGDAAERKRIEEEINAQWKLDHEEVVRLGGLHIVGTERHKSRRIDNQLRGRSGRQGDPGASRFYLSLEDDLMRIFGGDRLMNWMQRLGMEEGIPIEHGMVTRSIECAQKQVEAHNFDIRKDVLKYDGVLHKQRE